LYNDQTGALETTGSFLLEPDTAGREPTPPFAYTGADCCEVWLRDGARLVADGLLDHPFGDGHGKRSEWLRGERVGDEVQY
jgi:hypothetical protein